MTTLDLITSHERFLAAERALARLAAAAGNLRAAADREANCRRTLEVIARLKRGGYADPATGLTWRAE